MRRGAGSESERRSVGLLDAGVVLARLDRRHRSFAMVKDLFDRSRSGNHVLSISVVNLAEVLQHSRRYTQATGLDPVVLLEAFQVRIHQPDITVARRAAELVTLGNASLADRFAAATAEVLKARLYTTDSSLAAALRKRRIPCALF